MKVLIIGASGQVGNALAARFLKNEDIVEGSYCNFTDHSKLVLKPKKLDLQDADAVGRVLICVEPDLIFICGSATNVDWCESNPKESQKINVEGVKNVVDVIKNKTPLSKLIYFSSDYVFNGFKGFFSEDDTPDPINIYGQHKLIAENYVSTHLENYLIIRTNCVYGPDPQNKNFSCRLYENLKQGKSLVAPVDEYVTPTFVQELADEAWALSTMNAAKSKLYHIAGSGLTSRYRFAMFLAERFGFSPHLIQPMKSAEIFRKANRPLNGGLNCQKYEKEFQIKLKHYRDVNFSF